MSGAKDVTFSLSVMVNKERTKVIFAEAGNDFADVLFSFLGLPLGKIVQVLEKHYGNQTPVIGSLNTLYNGLANLDSAHFHRDETKAMLLNPKSLYGSYFLGPKINLNHIEQSYCSMEKTTSYIIGDDLRVMPNMKCSFIDTLSNLGIAMEDMEGADTRNSTFGFSEIMDILKMSFISRSRNPLTDLVLGNREMKSELGSSALHDEIEKEAFSTSSKKVTVKVMLQKSTNEFLYAQADECFIDYLFSILTIPLGKVEQLLGGKTCLKNIDNLYSSRADNAKSDDWLINPSLPIDMYTSNQLLPLNAYCYSPNYRERWHGTQNFLKGRRMFMVTDDLTVTPLGLLSTISILNGMKISLSDVQELKVDIGEREALNILRASLTSNTALTDALGLGLKRRVKQEH